MQQIKKICKCGKPQRYANGLCRSCYEKKLRKCNPEFAERQRKNQRDWAKKYPEKILAYVKKRQTDPIRRKRDALTKRKLLLKKKYGMTEDDYNLMYTEQDGKCLICKRKFEKLDIDHDHLSEKVRGLLCRSCNTLVGTYEKRMSTLFEAGRYLAKTGGGIKLDDNKLIFTALPVIPLMQLVDVYTKGAKKYGTDNWRSGILWSRVFDALQRHSWKWWNGEESDQEDGQHHLASVAWCALTLLEYIKTHSEFDDRPKK